MKYKKIFYTSKLEGNELLEGEAIETKIARVTQNKEPITDGAPIIYTDRKEGVIAAYDIRTDRFQIAQDAMDNVNKAKIAKRDSYMRIEKPSEPDTSKANESKA